MTKAEKFDLTDFTPYLLNIAAEASSLNFQPYYKDKYGMLRTEWRVVFHLGRYGPMTAKEICSRARIHKTKVSRAVVALEDKRFLKRETMDTDRRHERLSLTKAGKRAFDDLYKAAREFDANMTEGFTVEQKKVLRECLMKIAELDI